MKTPLPPAATCRPPALEADDALFLDFDGTLADLAPRPEAVTLVPGLIDTLHRLQAWLGGALAIVSGRPLSQLDAFLAPLRLPSAGVHGAERRTAMGHVVLPPANAGEALDPLFDAAERAAEALAARYRGLLVERKSGAVALHYRLAPEREAECHAVMQQAADASPALTLLHGKQVLELKSAAVHKGRAIEAFMTEAPFQGRRALFAGDDVTDEAGFQAVQGLGGLGIKIGAGPSVAQARLADPAALRAWLGAASR